MFAAHRSHSYWFLQKVDSGLNLCSGSVLTTALGARLWGSTGVSWWSTSICKRCKGLGNAHLWLAMGGACSSSYVHSSIVSHA